MKAIRIHPKDNVAVALESLDCGELVEVDGDRICLAEAIPKGHKFSLGELKPGDLVIKYGEAIGECTQTLAKGVWVHETSLKTRLSGLVEYRYQPSKFCVETVPPTPVNIYRRSNGDVGIRNELWVIPTVSCVNGIAANIVKEFLLENACDDIDGVHVFPHQFGCSQLGDDLQCTRGILRRMIEHPNAGGVLLLGLGCESNQASELIDGLNVSDDERFQVLVTQGVDDEIEQGVELMSALYQSMRFDKREPGLLSDIKFGLECGGSDGLSGITANPLLGAFSDFVIARGGTTVLTEVPEMFGAETLLMDRCMNEQVFSKLVATINHFKKYYQDHNQPIYENPSPGNKAGGLSTLEEKSLGCTQKAGASPVNAVVDYNGVIHEPGLNILSAPGNDAIATSALAAAGCHMVLFTTGRGTPYGGFVPTLKIATNTDLAARKKHWIDFNAGVLLEGEAMDSLLQQFLKLVVEVVNGRPCKNEINGYRELAIWKQGVTL